MNPRNGHAYAQYNKSVKIGKRILSDLIRIVDWTGLRKQQLYKGNNPIASKSIARYYKETQNWLSPVRQGINYYFVIARILSFADLLIFLLATVVLFNQLKSLSLIK